MKARKAKEFVFNDLLSMESYCINHYSESNFSCNVTQLSKSELVTSSICAPINDAHLEIFKSNQTILYKEEANQNSVAFCWINSNGEQAQTNTIISGDKMMDLSITGFNRLNKTGGNV